MKIINGFVTKSAFISNEPGVVSPFFELSPSALTFSKHRGEYQHPLHAGATLHTFVSKDAGTGEQFTLDSEQVKLCLDITTAVVGYMSSIVGQVLRSHFMSFMVAGFHEKIIAFNYGEILTNGDRLPDWISWMQEGEEPYEVRLWLSNASFETQYSGYEIVIVPPIDNLNLFFGNYADMATQLNNISYSIMNDRMQEKTEGYPPTVRRLMTFRYLNRSNPSQGTDAHWGFLIYGPAGDNVDSLKDALIDYLLKNSTRAESQWMEIFPKIFERTEFMMFPRWDKLAILNLNPLASTYSSIYKPTEMIDYVIRNAPVDYDEVFVKDNVSVIPFDYKAITCAVIPGDTNGDAVDELTDIFNDYIPVSTMDLDFNRMTIRTRDWAVLMVEAIKTSETATEFSTVLNPFRRVKRGNQIFISFLYDNVNYLVSVRANNLV
jgi:hypothetical protein